ncbi:MAG: hypothetical protein JWM43_3325 [Acidobacteriaceae bacterium]|nr:hypothetical protein [Acidobacteriaceae bacterium]
MPPRPDLESVQDILRTADIEGLIAKGAPADEYEPEEALLLGAIQHLPSTEIHPATLIPILEGIWHKSFAPTESDLVTRRPALESVAARIEHYFGQHSQY